MTTRVAVTNSVVEREYPEGSPNVEIPVIAVRIDSRFQQNSSHQEAAQHEEDIDSRPQPRRLKRSSQGADLIGAKMVEENESDRDRAQAIQLP